MTDWRPALLALCGLVLALAACGPARDSGDTIVLLGGEVFGAGERTATLLDELATATGVFGPSRFRLEGAPGERPAELFARLDALRGLRAVVAVVGDLSLMHEIAPNRAIPPLKALTSREIDHEALAAQIDELAERCAARGLTLVLATPPLGIQGRVEVPELQRVAATVRARAGALELPLLDLTKAFRAHEPGPLFADGLCRLDRFGQDLLARQVFDSLRREAVLPSRDPAEADARRAWDALLQWASGADDTAWRRTIPHLLNQPAADTRGEILRATLSTLHIGLLAPTRHRWRRVEPDDAGDLLGVLAIGRALCTDAVEPPADADPLVADLLAMLSVFHGAPKDGLVERAEAHVAAHPARLAPWIALETALRISGERRGVGREARAHLATFEAPPVALARVEQLFGQWPATLTALPATLLLEHAFRSFLPVGDVLQRARRQARVGRLIPARRGLLRSLRKLRTPPAWQSELDALRPG